MLNYRHLASMLTSHPGLTIVITILLIVGMYILFSKAGEPGWAAIVPFYNVYVLFKITWGSGILALLLLIPIVNLIIALITWFKLAKVFGKGPLFGLGLCFFSPVFILILGFGNNNYIGVR